MKEILDWQFEAVSPITWIQNFNCLDGAIPEAKDAEDMHYSKVLVNGLLPVILAVPTFLLVLCVKYCCMVRPVDGRPETTLW